MAKLQFIVGGAIGFVLGARAGRPAYERIKSAALGVAGSRPVQAAGKKADETVGEYVRKEATKMTDSVASAVKSKIDEVGRPKSPGKGRARDPKQPEFDDLPDHTHGESSY
ncbi:MAG TPA: YtxH domain-containing protein [Actinomycetaceae bacterium]|nr:YtxH domain-containing protein [Actinomycetaceae bacterium]